MQTLLQRASEALVANDAECLEELCRQVRTEQICSGDVAGLETALLAFQKQVRSARQNVVLRERLLHLRLGEEMRWVP